MTEVKSWASTDTGPVRKHNEDSMISRPELGLWAVADGVGGQFGGEIASGMIVSELARLPDTLAPERLALEVRRTLARVHDALRAESRARGLDPGIASTFAGLLLHGGDYKCLWAGDSRAYLYRQGKLSGISRDHSFVQELVDAGHLEAAQAEAHPHANVITRAVGADVAALELDSVTGTTEPGDIFLLCSDGLTKTIPDADIAALLAAPDDTSPADRLLAAALSRRARDNVTVIVIQV
jgi:protein phosphatase/serine/threonine-protein phosphatase Stp1